MHTRSRERRRPKTERKKCLHGLSAAWPHHSHHLTIPLLPHRFQLSLSSPHSSWSSGRLQAGNVSSCTSATAAKGSKQKPSCSHFLLQSIAGSGTPTSTNVQVGRKYKSYLNKQIHSVNATCGQTGSPKASCSSAGTKCISRGYLLRDYSLGEQKPSLLTRQK